MVLKSKGRLRICLQTWPCKNKIIQTVILLQLLCKVRPAHKKDFGPLLSAKGKPYSGEVAFRVIILLKLKQISQHITNGLYERRFFLLSLDTPKLVRNPISSYAVPPAETNKGTFQPRAKIFG